MRMFRIASVIVLSAAVVYGQGPGTFVAVHLEPNNTSYYQVLVDMVALADSFRVPLTLEFTPQWADTILADPSLLAQVRGWQKKGHEIAAHHHAVSYGAGGWDGYTNRPPAEYPVPIKYRGNMQDYFILLSRLAGDSLLLTGCITDAEADWPAGIPYRTEGHNVTEGLSRPVPETLNSQAVTRVGFGLVNTKLRVDTAKALFNSAGSKDVLGVVLHEKDHAVNPNNLRSWLQFLKDRGGTVKTVRRILKEYEKTTDVAGSPEPSSPASSRTELRAAFPNPFNASATVRFYLARSGPVCLDLADIKGRIIRTLVRQNRDSGFHTVPVDAAGLPSGVYFAVLRADGSRGVQKIILSR
jgi:hypothetical protein